MNFTTFFSKQARKPEGWFGRIVMGMVFDRGNAFLNRLVYDLMSVQTDDRIIEIGPGTGKLISRLARGMDRGLIEGVDFSDAMVSVARKRNKRSIARGKVKILNGDFDSMPLAKEEYSKACSVNTLYFWPSPVDTARKIAEILKPGGRLFLAFEDIAQLKQRNLNPDVFHFFSIDEVKAFLGGAGFSGPVDIVSREKGGLVYHCAVAEK